MNRQNEIRNEGGADTRTPGGLAAMFLGAGQVRQLSRKQTQWLLRVCSKSPDCRQGVNPAMTLIDGGRFCQFELRRWPNGTAVLAQSSAKGGE